MPIGNNMTRIRLLSKLGLLEPLVRLARWSEQSRACPPPVAERRRAARGIAVPRYHADARSR
jgi:hypothetical protein